MRHLQVDGASVVAEHQWLAAGEQDRGARGCWTRGNAFCDRRETRRAAECRIFEPFRLVDCERINPRLFLQPRCHPPRRLAVAVLQRSFGQMAEANVDQQLGFWGGLQNARNQEIGLRLLAILQLLRACRVRCRFARCFIGNRTIAELKRAAQKGGEGWVLAVEASLTASITVFRQSRHRRGRLGVIRIVGERLRREDVVAEWAQRRGDLQREGATARRAVIFVENHNARPACARDDLADRITQFGPAQRFCIGGFKRPYLHIRIGDAAAHPAGILAIHLSAQTGGGLPRRIDRERTQRVNRVKVAPLIHGGIGLSFCGDFCLRRTTLLRRQCARQHQRRHHQSLHHRPPFDAGQIQQRRSRLLASTDVKVEPS